MTSNLRPCPAKNLEPFGITAMRPDDFALSCIDANPVLAARIIADQHDPQRLAATLANELPSTAQALRELGV